MLDGTVCPRTRSHQKQQRSAGYSGSCIVLNGVWRSILVEPQQYRTGTFRLSARISRTKLMAFGARCLARGVSSIPPTTGFSLTRAGIHGPPRFLQAPSPRPITLVYSNHFPVDFAQLQGELYNQLYCAGAQKDSVGVKTEKARALAVRMTEIMVRIAHLEVFMCKN
jgi:hypothetical protein